MFQTDYVLVACTTDERLGASVVEAETNRMLREAGIDHRPRIVRRARRWLYRLGHKLVALGQRLVRYDASLEGHQPASHSQTARL